MTAPMRRPSAGSLRAAKQRGGVEPGDRIIDRTARRATPDDPHEPRIEPQSRAHTLIKGRNVLTQQGILERSLGLRVMLVAALLLVTAGAIFVATRSAEAIGTHITVVDADYGAANTADPTDLATVEADFDAGVAASRATLMSPSGATASRPPTFSREASVARSASGSPEDQIDLGRLARIPALGGAIDIAFALVRDDATTVLADIVFITVSLGGINSDSGPSTITINSFNPVVDGTALRRRHGPRRPR